ncbi:hypothetical protein ACQ4PT_009355 [Festuca glaucescens]
MADPPPPPQNLADLISKQQADHDGVVKALNDPANDLQLDADERRTDRKADNEKLDATLQKFTDALQAVQQQAQDTAQQRAQNSAILRLEQRGPAPRLGGPGLLSAHLDSSKAMDIASLTDDSDQAPRLYKIDFPVFDGESDPSPWLTRCNLFFLGQRTQESDKTWLVSYHLTGVAALWYGHLEAKIGRPSWDEFRRLISNHFGPPTRANPFGELISLRRSGTVADYSKRFLEHLTRVSPIPDAEERDTFTNNLGEPMKTQVEMMKPATLEAAMDLAVSFEHLHTVTTSTAHQATRLARLPRLPQPAVVPAMTDANSPAPGPVFKKLTAAEMDDRRAKGLCFNCDEKFVRGHHCKRLFYIQSADDVADTFDECDDELQISLLAITGVRTSDTMQLKVRVGDRELVTLLDSGSTHNFINEEIAGNIGEDFLVWSPPSCHCRQWRSCDLSGSLLAGRCLHRPRELHRRFICHPIGWFRRSPRHPLSQDTRPHLMGIHAFVDVVLGYRPSHGVVWPHDP